jgi:dipeptidyl aminopeptidase/acylaminoacyl peptidase
VDADWYDAGAGEGQYWEYACPRVSPDGRRVYFAESRGAVSDRRICEAELGGGAPRQTASGFAFDINPVTGQIASVTFSNVEPWGYGIEVLKPSDAASGRQVVPIAADRYADVAWSPDGSRMAATCWPEDSAAPSVVLIDAATGDVRTRATDARHPTWSPDGRWLAWVSEKGDAPLGLVAAPADDDAPAIPLMRHSPGGSPSAAGGPREPRALARTPSWSPR